MRAGGLSIRQLTALLTWDLTFLLLFSSAIGTGLGVLMSRLFIPLLQIGSRQSAHVPPFIVQISWDSIYRVYGLFALLMISLLAALLLSLRRMKIHQVIKLGDTI